MLATFAILFKKSQRSNQLVAAKNALKRVRLDLAV